MTNEDKPVMAMDSWPNNAAMFSDISRLGYFGELGSENVLDLTYGRGGFWKSYCPTNLFANDLYVEPECGGTMIDAMDLRSLIKAYTNDGEPYMDAVVWDAPYKNCLDLETQALTRKGWKSHNEVKPGDKVWSLDTITGTAGWEEVSTVNVYPAEPTDLVEVHGTNLSFVSTVDHRWPVLARNGSIEWRRSNFFAARDRVIHTAPRHSYPIEKTYSDEMVELIAWWWTEGNSFRNNTTYTRISQSFKVNPIYCVSIERCLESILGPATEIFPRTGQTSTPMWRICDEERGIRRFYLSAAFGKQLAELAPDRVPSIDFLEALTLDQLEMFIQTSLDADGQSDHVLSQEREDHANSFTMALILAGRSVSNGFDQNGFRNRLRKNDYSRPYRNGGGPIRTTRSIGVWCPTVPRTQTWLARRNGKIYFTGNSGTPTPLSESDVDARYGVTSYVTASNTTELIQVGTKNASYLVKPGGYIFVKLMDQIVSGKLSPQSYDLVCWLNEYWNVPGCQHKLRLHAEYVYPSYRPQPSGRRQLNPRRNYSKLLQFQREK